MPTDVDQALWAFERAAEDMISLVRVTSYGLRLAGKRIGDLAAAPAPLSAEMERLRDGLEHGDDRLSDLAVLCLGDHFRAFLARVLDLPGPPPLPASAQEVEALAGTPGALAKASFWVPLLLQLYRVALKGGALDRKAFEILGKKDLELQYPGGKVKLFRQGDRITLTEQLFEDAARALEEAARAIHLRLITA